MLGRKTISATFLLLLTSATAQTVDYSVASVPQENGLGLIMVTSAGDCVAMPIVKSQRGKLNWLTNTIIKTSPDGNKLAFISARDNTTNIYVKELNKPTLAMPRTNRTAVLDFSYSPDGKNLVFSDQYGDFNQLLMTDAEQGYICHQITTNQNDYSPVFTEDMSNILFCHQDMSGMVIWGYNTDSKLISSYCRGSNPCIVPGENAILVTRYNEMGAGEIWKVNYQTGEETCIATGVGVSFTSPQVSPDGRWVVFVGDSQLPMGNGRYFANTDIYICHIDGKGLLQLTYHAANDLSPVWSRDGKYIYFISQRGTPNGEANIWRLAFNNIFNPN